jgi:mannose-6-phosphate isomerase-like protein (cupin superfamily)
MKHIKTSKKRSQFNILATTADLQAAMMTLKPGGTSDDEPSNEHARSEQWLFVIAGSGKARIGKRKGQLRSVKLEANSLLLIEKGELHQIVNTGKAEMRTVNFYAPPAYDEQGEPMGAIKRTMRAITGRGK